MDKTIMERVNTILDSDPSLEDIEGLLAEIQKRIGVIEFRLRDIRGSERQQALDSGQPEDIVQLDDEARKLEAEDLQLRRCRERLRGAEDTARKAMALESFPSDLEQLDALLKAEADAAAALDQARGQVDRHLAKLSGSRTLVRGRDLPTGKEESVRQYCELRGIRADSRGELQPPGSLHQAQKAADAVGVPLPNLRPQFRASA